jgi:hypothetical protein
MIDKAPERASSVAENTYAKENSALGALRMQPWGALH